MKRRFFAMLLSLAMLFTLAPTAFAAESENASSRNTTWESATTLDHDLTINSGDTLTVKGLITIQGTVTISGGGTIKRGEGFADYMIVVPEGSTLTLENITVDGGAVWNGDNDATLDRDIKNEGIKATSAMIYNFGELLVTDGAVLQNNDNATTSTVAIATEDKVTGKYTFPSVTDKVRFGGAVLNGGQMKITGGSIQDNSVAWRGAGVASYGSIEMSGGTVQRNFAQNQWGDGGAFYLHGAKNTSEEGSAYCTISGGQLTANKAGGAGGAVCADGQSILNVSGGSFVGNVATTTGGGINVYSSILNMSDGTISGNSADQGGGLNLIMGSRATITGGHITSNKAQSGGGVQVADSAELDASNLVIGENEATNNGGGIYAPGAEKKEYSISLNGVSVKDNKAGTSSENGGVGGGICASRAWREESSTGTLTLTNSEITGNRGVNGGGIYLEAGITATMDGGEISSNIASTTSATKHPSGGGICLNGIFALNSGKISNNVKDGQWSGGAGVIVSGTFTMNGGEVSRNIDTCTAEEAHTIGGGAFYVMGGTLNIHGGNITGNASYRGGAIAFHYDAYARGTVNITGGTITGNYCTSGNGSAGGAIYMPTATAKDTQKFDQTVKISGNPVITGNYKGATITSPEGKYTIDSSKAKNENNIYLSLNQTSSSNTAYAKRQTLILGELTNGASIGVTTETPLVEGRKVQITSTETNTEYYKDAAQYFIPDAANVIAQANESGKYVELAYTKDTYHKVTLNLSHASVSIGSPTTKVKDGDFCTITIKADEGYTLPVEAPSGVTSYKCDNGKITASVMVKPTEDTNITIEAVANSYKVAFDGNGNTIGSMTKQDMTYDVAADLTTNAFVKTGYNFAGWSTTKNGDCEYPDKASVKNLTAENGGTVTLYAIWTKKQVIPAFSSSAIQSYKYDGSAKKYTLPSGINGFTITYKQGETTVTEPKDVGTYDVIISRAEDPTYAAFSQTITGGLVITKASSGSSSSNPTYSVTTPSKSENGGVAVSSKNARKGDTVTVTVTPDAGYQLDKLTVTDKNGNVLKLTDKGDGKYSFTMPDGKVEVKAVFAKEVKTSPFGDVSADAYYYKAVQWAQEKGITDGISSNLFGPKQPCTRSQIVTFLWRAAGSPEPKGTAAGMTDVVPDSYYAKAVAWAIENGITTGTAEGTFSPDATCTRAQAVTFLARAQNAKATGKTAFSDVPADSYFADAVAWAQANGVTTGTSETTFSPDSDCTRAQIVTFLYRANQGT